LNKRGEFLPFHTPSISEEEIEAVVETLRTGWISSGPRVNRFEREFADVVGVSHAVAVSAPEMR